MIDSQELLASQQEILSNIKTIRARKNLFNILPTKREALLLLNKMGFPPHIINHQLAVMRMALNLAHNIVHAEINIDLVRAGALLHDIGRFISHDLIHTAYGGDLLRELQFPEELARIAETHSLGGLSSDEAVKLGLPARDYMPRTLEEKIVCLADKYLSGTEKVSIEKRFSRWIEKYNTNDFLQEQIRRVKGFEDEILHLIHD